MFTNPSVRRRLLRTYRDGWRDCPTCATHTQMKTALEFSLCQLHDSPLQDQLRLAPAALSKFKRRLAS